jgi:hypothetical protein
MVQKFTPAPPRLIIKSTDVPAGEVSLNCKSPTKVCVTEAFGLPTVLLQPGKASSRKFRSEIAPVKPLTGRTTLTEERSGIATGGPV